ncbi:MAG: PLP-dependent aminotransferase family protein [Pseudomonadota bacterium]
MRHLPVSELLSTALGEAEFMRHIPRHRRVYEAIRKAILNQQLPPGSKLPSTRDLARDLSLSRNTILTAFQQLLAEGYVIAQTGSGTFVANTPPDSQLASEHRSTEKRHAGAGTLSSRAKKPAEHILRFSERGIRLTSRPAGRDFEIQPFAPGMADFSIFPFKLWQRLQNRYWRDAHTELLDYGGAGGYLPLRCAVAKYLRVSRSVNLTVDQVLITSGTQQSLNLCAQLLADTGDTAWVEDPCYWGARSVFEACDLRLHSVIVDNEGLSPQAADLQTAPRLIYLTPSHQYPKGVVMSLARRRLMLDIAERKQAWILEDDYDSEFRYAGRPIASLQGLDPYERVVYLGTFSKMLYPGIKIGYMVVPIALQEGFKTALYDLQRPGQMMLQAALSDFMEEGYFGTHIRKLRLLYGQRRELLLKTMQNVLGSAARISSEESGLHLVLELPREIDDVALARTAMEYNMNVRALSTYYLGNSPTRGLVIGYAYVVPEKIIFYGRLLANIVKAKIKP